jgi:hypothetical protein
MATILFWNINKKRLFEEIISLCNEIAGNSQGRSPYLYFPVSVTSASIDLTEGL